MSHEQTTALAIVPRSIEEAERLSQIMCKANILPEHFRNKPADVFVAISYGLEVGLTPINALQSIYVVHGRPGMYADAMVALVLASGKAMYFRTVEATDTEATVETLRRGDPEPRRLTITIAQAKKAGWTSNKKYDSEPARMLAARAKSTLCKDCYPDVLRGMASVEELRDEAVSSSPAASVAQFRAPEAPVIDAELVEQPKPDVAKNLAERMLAAATLDDLAAVGADIKRAALGKEQTAELRALYATRKRQLEQVAAQREADDLSAGAEEVA